jgi:DNA-binding CsgD family transcriptional regulator
MSLGGVSRRARPPSLGAFSGEHEKEFLLAAVAAYVAGAGTPPDEERKRSERVIAEAESLLSVLELRARSLDRAVALARAGRCRGLLHAAACCTRRREISTRRCIRSTPLSSSIAAHRRRSSRHGHWWRSGSSSAAPTGAAPPAKRSSGRWRASRRSAPRSGLSARRRELVRLGLRRDAGDELTPAEQQVAERAGSGMTNREIAAAFFISPGTVEANLARIYRKLGIRSRAELVGGCARGGRSAPRPYR